MALESHLPEIIVKIDEDVRAAVAAGAELVVTAAKNRVPVASGALQRSIHAEPDLEEEGFQVLAGGKDPETGDFVYWGLFVEHGSAVGVPPHPFLVPALEENRDTIVAMIAEALRKAT